MQTIFRRAAIALLAAAVALLCTSSQVSAAPVKVNLRVEASTTTLFEGPVTTDAKTLTKDGTGAHKCDGTNGGANASPGPTLTTALDDGSIAGGFTWDATWSSGFDDFFINRIGPDTNGGPPNFPSWGYARNYVPSQVGGCQEKVQAGDDVLFARFLKVHLLKLAGPASANTGQPVVVSVTDGQNGMAVAGASVAGQLTGADGKATVQFGSAGKQRLKAERADSVRSNALEVCVHNGDDGTCGTTAPSGAVLSFQPQNGAPGAPGRPGLVPSLPRVRGINMAQQFSRSHAPQLLHGTVKIGSNGLAAIKLRLWRHHRGRCWYYSGDTERLVESVCGRRKLFSVGADADWSYLLPFRLPPGRYRLHVLAYDRDGNASVTSA